MYYLGLLSCHFKVLTAIGSQLASFFEPSPNFGFSDILLVNGHEYRPSFTGSSWSPPASAHPLFRKKSPVVQ